MGALCLGEESHGDSVEALAHDLSEVVLAGRLIESIIYHVHSKGLDKAREIEQYAVCALLDSTVASEIPDHCQAARAVLSAMTKRLSDRLDSSGVAFAEKSGAVEDLIQELR